MKVKRRPVRGFFAGLFLGLGLSTMLVIYGVIAFGTLMPFVVLLVGIVVGVLWAYVAPARGTKQLAPAVAAPESAPPPPPPDSELPPPPYTPA